jgi:TRAP-type mannitol/chloroaromatic compound transport system permease small subunit
MAEASGGTSVPAAADSGRPLPFGFHYLTRAMNAVGTLWIFFLMVLMTADVAGRNLFDAPIRGALEITTLSIVSIVYLQLADTLRNGQLTRSDAWLMALRRRHPAAAAALQSLFHLTGALFVGVMCVASIPLLVESWQNGEYLGAIGDFQAWLWPMRAVVVIGSACTVLTFLFLAFDDLRDALQGGRAQ